LISPPFTARESPEILNSLLVVHFIVAISSSGVIFTLTGGISTVFAAFNEISLVLATKIFGYKIDIGTTSHEIENPAQKNWRNWYLTDEDYGTLFKYLDAYKIMTMQLNYRHPLYINFDYVIDAIDTLSPKIHLIKSCMENKIPLVSSMGAGAKIDPSKVTISDISKSYNDRLAFVVRKTLRKHKIYKGFKVVFSSELVKKEAVISVDDEKNKRSTVGSISYLTFCI